MPAQPDGTIQITVPDTQYPADLDHPLSRPIPPEQQLQPGPLDIRLIASHPIEGVEGGLDPGKAAGIGMREDERRITHNNSRFVPHYFE